MKWYRQAIAKGDVRARCNLDFLEKMISAMQGDADAQYNLGLCYADGRGVSKSYAEAVKWYCKAAEQGHTRAQNNLGNCYSRGQGVLKDMVEAVKWYRKAAEQGYVVSQLRLGECYENGEGVPMDKVEAIKWYRKIAEKNGAWEKLAQRKIMRLEDSFLIDKNIG